MFLWWCGGVFVVVWWCFCGGVFVVVFSYCLCGAVFVVVFLKCLCGGVCVVVFLWWCFCGGVLAVVFLWWCGGVFVVVFSYCLCGGVFVVVFLWWCSCGGVFCGGVFVVFVWWCFYDGVVVFLWRWFVAVVFLWWCFCGGVFVVVFLKCLCGGVFVVVVFLWWSGGVFVVVFSWWCLCGDVFCGGVVVFLWWWGGVFVVVLFFFLLGWACEWLIVVVDLPSICWTSSICWISIKFLVCLDFLDLNELLDHTSMSTSSMSWSSMTGSCASISLTWFTWLDVFLEWRDLPYLTWPICLELFDFTWFALLPRLLFLACISTFQEWSVIGNRHVERHHLGVTRNALRENRLVIFGLCSIGLRRHGPFISCHIFLPLCFALSGTHLGSSFPLYCVCLQVVETNPRTAIEGYSQVVAQLSCNNSPSAVMELTKCLCNRALCFLKLGKWDSAMTDSHAVLEREPANVKAHFRLASALFKGGHVEDQEAVNKVALHASIATALAKKIGTVDAPTLELLNAIGSKSARPVATADEVISVKTPSELESALSLDEIKVIVLCITMVGLGQVTFLKDWAHVISVAAGRVHLSNVRVTDKPQCSPECAAFCVDGPASRSRCPTALWRKAVKLGCLQLVKARASLNRAIFADLGSRRWKCERWGRWKFVDLPSSKCGKEFQLMLVHDVFQWRMFW